jgi:hypothetical protein
VGSDRAGPDPAGPERRAPERGASRQAWSAPSPAAWRPAASARSAPGDSGWPVVDSVRWRSTIRPARPISTGSPTTAVVSPKPSSIRCVRRQASLGNRRTRLSPFGDKPGSWQIRPAPIVSAPPPDRVRKPCRTVSYTVCVVTVCKDGVKSAVVGARPIIVRRKVAYGADY